MRCPSCRGGGMGVPSLVPIPIRVREEIRALLWGVGIGKFGFGGLGGKGWAGRRVDGLVSRTVAMERGLGKRKRKNFEQVIC